MRDSDFRRGGSHVTDFPLMPQPDWLEPEMELRDLGGGGIAVWHAASNGHAVAASGLMADVRRAAEQLRLRARHLAGEDPYAEVRAVLADAPCV